MVKLLTLPMARTAIDRDYLARVQPGLFENLASTHSTRYLLINRGRVLLDGPAEQAQPRLHLIERPTQVEPIVEVYLGRSEVAEQPVEAGAAVVLWVVDDSAAHSISSDGWHQLRRTGAGLSALHAGLYTQALALSNWHATHQYCPRCGTLTNIDQAGWVRVCPQDSHQVFPRTDPAIIVSVIDQHDRILLGSQGVWEDNRWSILAGFVEPGESLTAAVRREMFEEAGVRVVQPEYLGSQAWPFPYSLMVGFTAKVDPAFADADLAPDGDEIEKLRWFSRADIEAEASSLLLPGRMSISRAIIEHWYGSEIVSATELGQIGS